MKIYQKVEFWQKLEKQLALIGAIAIGTAGFNHAPYWVFESFGIAAFIGKSIFIWIEDKDNNGIVDWYDKTPKE